MSAGVSTGVLTGQVVLVLAIAAAGVALATQWTAATLGYQARLGAPWFVAFTTPIYYPWRLFQWWYFYNAYAPSVFARGGAIAAGSGLVSAGAAIAASVWRARQAKRATTYGSARWASRDEIRVAGLLNAAGVFLGRHGRDYLRHDGPRARHGVRTDALRQRRGSGGAHPAHLAGLGRHPRHQG